MSDEPLIVVPGKERPSEAPAILDAAGAPVPRPKAPPPKAKHCGWRVDGCGGNCRCACSPCAAAVLAEGFLKAKEDSREVAVRHYADKHALGVAGARRLMRQHRLDLSRPSS